MPDRASRPTRKILLLSHYFPSHGGGIEIAAGSLAGHLVREYPLEIIWAASDCDRPPAEIPGLSCLPMSSWNVIEDCLHIAYPLWDLASLMRVWKLSATCDLVHVHEYPYTGSIIACIAAAFYGKPLVITQHVGFVPVAGWLLRAALTFFNHVIARALLSRASRVVFVSDAVAAYFCQHVSFRHPPMVINNGVDSKRFLPAIHDVRQVHRLKLHLPTDKPLFLFAGRFVEKKGLPILQALASHFQEIHWVFAGKGPIDPQSWGLENVSVYRAFPHAEMPSLYQAADLLVLPSRGEGFPLAVQEAMSCGTPVLISEETAKAITAAQHLFLTVQAERADALKQCIERIDELLADESTLVKLRPAVADFALNNWSWERLVETYYKLFSRLIDRSSQDCASAADEFRSL